MFMVRMFWILVPDVGFDDYKIDTYQLEIEYSNHNNYKELEKMIFTRFKTNMDVVGVQLGYNWGTIQIKKEAKQIAFMNISYRANISLILSTASFFTSCIT